MNTSVGTIAAMAACLLVGLLAGGGLIAPRRISKAIDRHQQLSRRVCHLLAQLGQVAEIEAFAPRYRRASAQARRVHWELLTEARRLASGASIRPSDVPSLLCCEVRLRMLTIAPLTRALALLSSIQAEISDLARRALQSRAALLGCAELDREPLVRACQQLAFDCRRDRRRSAQMVRELGEVARVAASTAATLTAQRNSLPARIRAAEAGARWHDSSWACLAGASSRVETQLDIARSALSGAPAAHTLSDLRNLLQTAELSVEETAGVSQLLRAREHQCNALARIARREDNAVVRRLRKTDVATARTYAREASSRLAQAKGEPTYAGAVNSLREMRSASADALRRARTLAREQRLARKRPSPTQAPAAATEDAPTVPAHGQTYLHLPALTEELTMLALELQKRAASPDELDDASAVRQAVRAARAGDHWHVEQNLARTGPWVQQVAEEIGAGTIVAAVRGGLV
jgi:hypothetical protein